MLAHWTKKFHALAHSAVVPAATFAQRKVTFHAVVAHTLIMYRVIFKMLNPPKAYDNITANTR